MGLEIVKSAALASAQIGAALEAPEPYFLGRAGGSDTTAAVFCARDKMPETLQFRPGDIQFHRSNVEKYNGFYDLEAGSA